MISCCAASGSCIDHRRIAVLRMAEPPLGPAAFAVRDFARFDRALGQQPGDDVHDPGRHLQQFAGEADPRERLERRALVAPGVVEIGPRLVGQQHRLGVKRVDQARRDPRLRARAGPIRPSALKIAIVRAADGNARASAGSAADAPRDCPSSGQAAQAMMSGMFESTICWIWSLSMQLAALQPRDLELVARRLRRQRANPLVELRDAPALSASRLGGGIRRRSSPPSC